ncbi:hypothetical protein AKJ52_00450 [candidate division MSBL1 archaeon SCGC-AAA382C18]|uniref:Uncharacterized protein n=1 Tax=candidate division MSBL1 archaeon SCGC-AAA382C18 TaxID=1698281 RepID=A0A133VLJ2_9EURY|nr:hypothetical protein AKJ52_00450 [candidate division MSBL1 archaeon SCGC-AAA382C18]
MSLVEEDEYEVISDKEKDVVHIHDNRDRSNLPAAFIIKKNGDIGNPRTFKRALKLAKDSNGFEEAIQKWEENGIRYHYFCRVD